MPLAPILFRVACYILESPQDAEDVLQDAYLRLWRDRASLDGVRDPKGYTIRMVRNLCIDRLRRAARHTFPERLPDCPADSAHDEDLDRRERLDRVAGAIGALPEKQREVLMLRTVEGLSYEEIASRTQMSQLTLRVLLSRARAKLKSIE